MTLSELWANWEQLPDVVEDLEELAKVVEKAGKLLDYKLFKAIAVSVPSSPQDIEGIQNCYIEVSNAHQRLAKICAPLSELLGRSRRLERSLQGRWLSYTQDDAEWRKAAVTKLESFFVARACCRWGRALDRAKSFMDGLDRLERHTDASLRALDNMARWV